MHAVVYSLWSKRNLRSSFERDRSPFELATGRSVLLPAMVPYPELWLSARVGGATDKGPQLPSIFISIFWNVYSHVPSDATV